MAAKKFYWLKLKRDFFKRHDIRIIESMPNGKDYILFYLKMLLESIDHEGELRFSDAIPYNEQMLAVITNTNIDIVKAAMTLFIDLRMVDVMDDQTIYMMEVEKLIGSESESAERMRRHRKNTRPSLCDANVQKSDAEIEIETEKETEQEIDYSAVVSYLNEKAGTSYKHTTAKTRTAIRARVAEGFTLEDFRTVIDKKCAEWMGTDMEKYLRPETLFGTKFEGYLNARHTERSEVNGGSAGHLDQSRIGNYI